MRICRILPLNETYYSKKRQRFTSSSFKDSSDKSGISVVHYECAKSIGICAHLFKYYDELKGVPPIIFWIFSLEHLKDKFPNEKIELVQQDTLKGDKCHYNLTGLNEQSAADYRQKYCVHPNVFYCCAQAVKLEDEQVRNIFKFKCP